VLPQSVSSLISHTIEHFTSEEDYMKKIQFSEWSEHCEIHKVFLDRLVSLEKKMGANDLFVLGDNELNEIARWLFNHILTDDKDYAIFAARLANVQLAEC
jgi:hemerythrin-like metal-binding protein